MNKCRGVCERRADGIRPHYATGLRFCPICCLSFRLFRRCPCCLHALRRRAKTASRRDRTAPDSRIVVPPRRTRANALPATPATLRQREASRRVYWRDPDKYRAKRRAKYHANIEAARARAREAARKIRRKLGMRPLVKTNSPEHRERARELARQRRLKLGMRTGCPGRLRVCGRPAPEGIR